MFGGNVMDMKKDEMKVYLVIYCTIMRSSYYNRYLNKTRMITSIKIIGKRKDKKIKERKNHRWTNVPIEL